MRPVRLLLFIFIILDSCVDKFNLNLPQSDQLLVVDGMITDEPGPYTVKLQWSSSSDELIPSAQYISGAQVIIKDSLGGAETLTEVGYGNYQTSPNGIQGEPGKTYHVEIKTPDGKTFSSIPEKLQSAGAIDSLYFEFEQKVAIANGVPVPANGFNIYINGSVPANQKYLKWNWTGTYEVYTHPELVTVPNTGMPGLPSFLAAPLPCSGYITSDYVTIQQVDMCMCCRCWYNKSQEAPILSNSQLIVNNRFNEMNVAFIPATARFFYQKYHFEIQQLSTTETTYNFWKLVLAQINGSSSLFQPPIAKINGNVLGQNTNDRALGIFSVCGVKRKVIWIYRSDIPYNFDDEILKDDCRTLC